MLAANWVPELIELAGGHNGLSIGGQHSVYHDWVDVAAYDPQVIFVSPCGFDLARTRIEARGLSQLPGWNDCSAVRAGRVFAVDGNAYLNRSGPRLVESVEILAHLLHPDMFPAADGAGNRPGGVGAILKVRLARHRKAQGWPSLGLLQVDRVVDSR